MRIHSIDYLRGFMAVSVVLYHFNAWFLTLPDSGSLLGKLGIYAVSSFYVISGMALFLAHNKDAWDFKYYILFLIKRFVRLAPIYWAGMLILTVFCFTYYKGFKIDWYKYAENISLSFGLLNPSGYLLTGGWSIGNEVVFYLMFPAFCVMCKGRLTTAVLFFISLVLLFYCSFLFLSPDVNLAKQWIKYINPFNQVYFFIFGIITAKLLIPYVGTHKRYCVMGVITVIVLFTLMPSEGNQINIVSGYQKIIFTFLVVALCGFVFIIMDLKEVKVVHILLEFLGDISYPLYLTHGVAFLYFKKIVFDKGITSGELYIYGALLFAVIIFASWLCHIFIEKPMINSARRLLVNRKSLSAQ